MELRYFDKHFVKNPRKKGPAWKIFRGFLLDILKITLWIQWIQSDGYNQSLFSKIRALFLIFKKSEGKASPFSLVVRLVKVI